MTPAFFPDWWLANLTVLGEQLREPSFDAGLLARYFLQALATSLPALAADYFLGLGILRRLNVTLARPLHHAAAIGLGAGIAGLCLFFYGTFGRFTGRGLWLFTAMQLLLGLSLLGPSFRLLPLSRKLLWLLPVLLLTTLGLMMPVLDYDSTMYHMASAKHYLSTGRLDYHGGIRFNAQPHLTVLLYLRQWALTEDASLTKLVNLEFLAIHLLLFGWLARRFRVPNGEWAAGGLVFGTPIFCYVAQVEYADFLLATWLGLGFSVLLASRHYSSLRLALAGLLLGFSAASKLQGLVVVACVLLAWLVVQMAVQWKNQLGLLRVLRPALLLGAGVILAGFPWWLRSYRNTGSPFFPFLTDSPDVKSLFTVNASYGVGRDVLSFLLTPWHMIVVPPPKFADIFPFGPSCLLLLLLGGTALFLRRRVVDRGTSIALLASFFFTVFWFRSGQVMRYEACLLLLWAFLLLGALRRLNLPRAFPLLLFVPLLGWSWLMTNNLVRFALPPPVTWPATQGVLRNVLPYYRATLALQGNIERQDKVYLWFCDEARFYVPGRTFGDWFGTYTYPWIGNVGQPNALKDLPSLLARLKSLGFRYVLADRERARQMATIYGPGILKSGLVDPQAAIPGVEILFDDRHYVVFRIL